MCAAAVWGSGLASVRVCDALSVRTVAAGVVEGRSAHVCVCASVTVRDQLYWIQNKHGLLVGRVQTVHGGGGAL